ncbi:hypothetical protein HHJ02_01065 [Akkermansia muciniphila]|uniref:hypothetical protein n=1 Tax=Akkermansia muciniphila TaxID=239935 RepID=UPI001BFF81F1|nr:hypothetical protein [Akkermansia muciniphila]MBT8783087.1 hypothetical protein [Akkermansia muciniphila]MBT8789397.1 hypothetical protein [Akkermansia muciniphila]WPK61642.1 hypothetical protein PE433_08050 [Akkermansia muciniphila]
MEFTILREDISLYMSIIATIVSIFTAYRQYSRDKLRVEANFKLAIVCLRQHAEHYISIEIINKGRDAVYVQNIYFPLNNKQNYFSSEAIISNGGEFPIKLEPFSNVSVYYPQEDYEKMKKLGAKFAEVKLGTGKSIKTNSFPTD